MRWEIDVAEFYQKYCAIASGTLFAKRRLDLNQHRPKNAIWTIITEKTRCEQSSFKKKWDVDEYRKKMRFEQSSQKRKTYDFEFE